jgi:glucose-1-phosphate thymidylyltransferase
MRGIILAGGSGTRLHPITQGVSKQLLPVYDKPMIYYPLSLLMMAGIQEVLIISTPHDTPAFERLLGDGSTIGMRIEYAIQPIPDGLAQAFIIGEEFIENEKVCLVLGDNIFFGTGLGTALKNCVDVDGGHVFAYHVSNPSEYGVVEFDDSGKAISLEEKPKSPKSSSVIIPVFNAEETIDETLESIKNEFAKSPDISWEVIAVDDGSTDGSLEVLESWQNQLPLKIFALESHWESSNTTQLWNSKGNR